MTARPARIVDTHVHLWDPARADWYPYLSGRADLGMGDISAMARRFDRPTYLAEAGGWNVVALVNVAAATGPHSVDETLELGGSGQVEAVIGGLPPTGSVAEAVELIDRQRTVPTFRGVRPMGRFREPLPPPEVLRALEERGLVFELLARPHQLAAAARGLAGHEGLTVVVEHAGWPGSGEPDERDRWRQGLEALAAAGPNVHCKLSGVVAAAGAMTPAALRPWLEPAIEAFGADRCVLASNFPVDGIHGSLDRLWSAYAEVVAGVAPEALDSLFAVNATRLYGIA